MRSWMLVAGFVLAAGPVWAVDTQAPGYRELERVVAVVNEDVVLLSEVEEAIIPALASLPPTLKGADRQRRVDGMRKEVLDGLIADKLLQQQVDQLHVEVTTEEIDRAVHEVQRQNGLDDAALKQALAQQGMGMAQYRDTLRKQLLKAKIMNIKVRSRVTLTEKDIQATVARRSKAQKTEYKVHARHAVFMAAPDAAADVDAASKARAQAFLEALKAGGDFTELARTTSDPITQNGGDLGFIRRGDMAIPEFETAVFNTAPGAVAGPIKTPLGWHIIQVLERRSLDNRTKDQVEGDIRDQLMAEELDRAFKRYVSELRNAAHVEVRL